MDAVARFRERFAGNLVDAGIPRMPARVFTALLTTEDGALTAAELAALLQISPAAVSGAVRYLEQVHLVHRERQPGSRRDRYRILDDAWYESSMRREGLLQAWRRTLADGVEVLGAHSAAGERLTENVEFIDFLLEELPAMLERWQVRRARRPT